MNRSLLRPCLTSLALGAASVTPCAAQGLQFTWPVPAGFHSASSAGDVDADGVPDFVFGEVALGGGVDRARVRSGHTGAELLVVTGVNANDEFGSAVTSLGDVNGDGHADFAVSAPYPVGSTPGYVRVHSGANGTVLWRADAPSTGLAWGRSLARLHDLDLDGVDELVVGAPGGGAGAFVFSGASGALLRSITGVAGAGLDFATAVAPAGDIDQDGVEDLLVGDPETATQGAGRVTIHSGMSGALVRTITGPVNGGAFGTDVASLGDIDGDGVPDLVVAAPLELITPSFNWGRARLYSGASGAPLLVIQDGPNLARFGEGVERAPDLDGDGRADVLLGAGAYRFGCCAYSQAEARIYSSVSGALLQSAPGSHPGLALVPDANGDGIDDFVIPAVLVGSSYSAALSVSSAPVATTIHTSVCTPKPTSQGCTPWLYAYGAPSTTQGDNLAFLVVDVVPNSFGMCLWSTGSAQTPFAGGMLCLAQPFHRWPIASTGTPQSTGACFPMLSGTLVSRISKTKLALTGLAPGQSFFAQAWFRDPGFAPPNDVGLSSALQITLWP